MGPLQGLKTVGDTISEMAVSSWPGSGHDCADIDRTSPTGRWWWSLYWLVVAQLPSHFQLFAIPRTATHQASLSFTISTSLLKFMSIESVMLSSHLILCCPLLLQSFPALGCFPVSKLFTSGGQSIGASASASVLPMTTQDWFPLGLTGLISFLSKGL